MIFSFLLWFHKRSLTIFPAPFRAEFASEMVEVFQTLLAQQAGRGRRALLVVGLRELYQLPPALWRAYLVMWRKKQVGQLLWRFLSQSPFHSLPPANDGRFSRQQLILEMTPLVVTAVCLFMLTYYRPDWVPANWQRQWVGLGWFTVLFAAPFLLWGLVWGLPRWAYPAGGLLLGYSLLLAYWYRLTGFWAGLLLAAFVLALAAVHTHRYNQPLPPSLQRLGHSLALDWTRLAFGLYAGLMPWLLLLAVDGVYRLDGTPYLAVSLLLWIVGGAAYGRSQRQPQQFALLIAAVSATLLPPLLHQAAFRGGLWRWLADPALWLADLRWIGLLWAFMISLLLLPLLGRLVYQSWPVESALPVAKEWPGERQ